MSRRSWWISSRPSGTMSTLGAKSTCQQKEERRTFYVVAAVFFPSVWFGSCCYGCDRVHGSVRIVLVTCIYPERVVQIETRTSEAPAHSRCRRNGKRDNIMATRWGKCAIFPLFSWPVLMHCCCGLSDRVWFDTPPPRSPDRPSQSLPLISGPKMPPLCTKHATDTSSWYTRPFSRTGG